MRGDDAIGPMIAGKLKKVFKKTPDLMVINAETVPENYTGTIRKETPSHIIFIDAVEMKSNPGHIRLVQREEIADYSISTHAMPISFMIKYLESFTDARMLLIGIQPKNMEMNNSISDEVQESVEKLTGILMKIFNV